VLNPLSYLQNATKDIYNTEFVNNQFQSDYYIKNGSFLKMDNIGLGYNVGKLWNEKANLSINFNCQNVFIITNYKGLDPEIFGGLDRNLYPRPRFYVLGVNLDF
jgi:iron complex outermembrane receptor protein